jgi:hypothetical protein
MIAAGLLALAAAFVLGVIFLQTPHGTVRIEINDPKIKATLNQDEIKFAGADAKEIRVKPGKHGLTIERDGFTFDTTHFELKSRETVTLKVQWFAEGKLQLVQDGKVVGAKWVKADGAPIFPPTDYALSFDGVSSYVDIPRVGRNDAGPRTIEAWVTPARLPPDKGQPSSIIAHWGKDQSMIIAQDQDKWRSLAYSSKPKFHAQNRVTSPGEVKIGLRIHLAGVWDGKENHLFVNGWRVPHPEKWSGALFYKAHDGTRLGAGGNKMGFPDGFWAGVMDEVRISKVARYDKDFTPAKRFEPDADTLALYHFDEGQGDKLTDSSGNGHHGKITGAKRVKADGSPLTAPRAVNGLSFDGKASHVATPLFYDGTHPITFEAFVTPRRATGMQSMIADLEHTGCELGLHNGLWILSRTRDPKTAPVTVRSQAPATIGEEVHFAGVLDGGELRLFINGQLQNRVPYQQFVKSPCPLVLGANPDDPIMPPPYFTLTKNHFDGVFREVRISKVARYDKDFTPQKRFETDADTLALYHFDEGQGDKLIDSSGNGHHGKIVGAKWVKADGTQIAPQVDHALSFDGSSAHVVIPTLGRDDAGPITLEAYVIPARLQVDNAVNPSQSIIQLDGSRIAYLQQYGTKWRGYAAGTLETWSKASTAGDAKIGRRVHVAVAWDGKQTQLFVDGRRAGEESRSGKISLGTAARASIGASRGKDEIQAAFAGVIDEVRISKIVRYDKDFIPAGRFEPDKDTVALYHFDEGQGDKLIDSSGNGHHGKIVGAKWVKADGTPIVTPPDYALSFDGKSSFVDIPTVARDDDGPRTYEAWLTPARSDAKARGTVLQHTGKAKPLSLFQFGDKWNLFCMSDLKPQKLSRLHQVHSGNPSHVAAIWDGKNLQLFIDGKRLPGASEEETPGSTYAKTGGTRLGASGLALDDLKGFWAGVINELRISKVARYDRTFTPAKRFEPDADTIALYHFDEGQGDKLTDSSGNGHHGKIVGAKWVKVDGTPLAPAIQRMP